MLACRSASSSAVRLRSTSHVFHQVEEVYAESSRRAQHRFIHSTAARVPTARDHSFDRRCLTTTSTALAKQKQPTKHKQQKAGPKQQRALQKAVYIAESLKKASLTDITPSDRAAVDTFVRPQSTDDSVTVSKTPEVQIADILKDRPTEADLVPTPVKRSGREGESSYRRRYKSAFDRIATSFNVSQIKSIGGSSRSSKGNKAMHIQMIMDRAGWPVPQAPTKAQEVDVKLSSKLLDLPENELFLFLRDTKLIHDLIINQGIAFEVVAGAAGSASGPYSQVLKVTGNDEQLDKLTHVLRKRVEHMTVADLTKDEFYGFEPSTGLLRFLSNVTGAHVETLGSESGVNYRVSTMNPAKVALMKRCLHVAALRSRVLPSTRSRSVLAPPDRAEPEGLSDSFICSTLPFFSTPSNVIPWNHLANDYAEILYRLRRTSNWNSKPGKREVIHRDEHVENGRVILVDQPKRQPGSSNNEIDFGSYVNHMDGDRLSIENAASKKVTTTTFGYLLLRKTGGAPGDFLSAPIQGQFPGVEAQNRLHQADRSIFSPSLTPSMIHNGLKNPPQHIRRLNYRSEDGTSAVTFSYVHPQSQPAPSATPESAVKNSETARETDNWLDKLDQMVADLEKKSKEDQEAAATPAVAESEATEQVTPSRQTESADANEEHVDRADDLESVEKDWLAELERSVAEVDQEEKRRQIQMTSTGAFDTAETAEVDSNSLPQTVEQTEPMEIIAERSALSEVDLLMPDRPIDARLAVRTSTVIDEIPDDIIAFFSHVVAQSKAEDSNRSKEVEAPGTLTVAGQTFLLEKDEDMQVAESYAPGEDVVLRSVSTKDMILGVERYTQHTELEYEGMDLPSRYWRELANVTRDVAPRAGSALGGQYLM